MHEGDLELIGPRPKRKLGILRQVGHLVHACAWIRAYGDVLGTQSVFMLQRVYPFPPSNMHDCLFMFSTPQTFVQRSSDFDAGMAGEYAGRKELRLHFFLFSDLILFARVTRELAVGQWSA